MLALPRGTPIAFLTAWRGLQEGRILVGGVDIHSMDLRAQRAAMSVIPQEPFMFTGTLRDNLDPFCVYSDERLTEVLAEVGLAAQVRSSEYVF